MEDDRVSPSRATLRDYALALGVVLISTGMCALTRTVFDLADQAMIYLLGVLVVASRLPRGPSFFAGLAAVAALDFFFVPPFHTFIVASQRHIVTFAVMLTVSLVVSSLTLRIRDHAEAARQRERRTGALYSMTKDLVVETAVGEIARAAVRHAGDVVRTDTVVLLADRASGRLVPIGEPPSRLAPALPAAQRALDSRVALADSGWFFLPMIGTKALGVLGVDLAGRGSPLAPAQTQLLEAFVGQTALAVERALLAEEAEGARVTAETERLRSTLLSAVSHDLRTPLASIRGSAEVLLEGGLTGEEERRELLGAIRDEADRLARLVGDLLDLGRVESGAVRLKKEWVPLEEVIGSALARLEAALEGRDVKLDLPREVVLVPVDPVLFEQALIHILENASKYTPPGTPIEIRATPRDRAIEIEVSDRGPGLPPGEEERVFEKFYRATDRRTSAGAGLGLTVCHAIVRAHGGSVRARNNAGGGASFTISIPIEGEPPPMPAAEAEEERA